MDYKPWQWKSWTPFSDLKPLNDVVPGVPFVVLPEIADRARRLLPSRNEDEITNAAILIDMVIETYYDSLRDDVINKLLQEYPDSNGILKKDSHDEEDIAEISRRKRDIEFLLSGKPIPGITIQVPDFPTRDDVPDFESLKGLEKYFSNEIGGLRDGLPSEYFGALALRYIEDCLQWLDYYDSGIKNGFDLASEDKSISTAASTSFSDSIIPATRSLVYAVESVCYGEHLEQLMRLDVKSANVFQTDNEMVVVEVARRISEMSKKGAMVRHAENRKIAETIQAWYLENRADFKSLDSAAEYACTEVVPISFRTARKHIGYAVKKLRSAGTV
ncbi:MAG: hypothetical protein WC100_03060 [Sterolibacterium sp.]